MSRGLYCSTIQTIKGDITSGTIKRFSEYESSCNNECVVFHKIIYLEHIYQQKLLNLPHPLETLEIKEFLNSDSALVRRLAYKICRKTKKIFKTMLRDPCHLIRLMVISKCKNIKKLKRFIKDENKDIRIAATRKLFMLSDRLTEDHLIELYDIINDKSYLVRLEFVKGLQNFKNISDEFILKLFDKEDYGLFVYAAEDEYHTIRKEIVAGIEAFVTEKTKEIIFDYIINMLNDESEEVRMTSLTVLTSMAVKHELFTNRDQISFIVSCLEESNSVVKLQALKLISKLKYNTIDVYFKILNQRNIMDSEILKCVRKIVKNNSSLFIDNLQEIYDPSTKEKESLHDLRYLGKLLLIKTLSRFTKIQQTEVVRKDMPFLKLKFLNPKRHKFISESNDLAMKIIQFINYYIDKGIINTELQITDKECQSGCDKFLKCIFDLINQSIKSKVLPSNTVIPFRFSLPKRLSFKIINEDQNNILGFLNKCCKILKRMAKNKKLMKKIKYHEFIVSAPDSVVFRSNYPLKFKAFLYYELQRNDLKLVVEDSDRNKLTYNLAESVEVVIYNPSSILTCYIGYVHNNEVMKLSADFDIKCIEKNE